MTRRIFILMTIFCLVFTAACSKTNPNGPMTFEVEKPAITQDVPDVKTQVPSDAAIEPNKDHQTDLRHATAFKVDYKDGHKYLTVLHPWRDAEQHFEYILVQRDNQPPADVGEAQVIEVPVRNIASLAATHLAYLTELDDLDKLTAVANPEYVSSAKVQEGLGKGEIQAVGNGPDINLEKLLSLNPDVVTTLALGKSNKDDYSQLMAKGIKTVIFSDFMEETPLGRAEWIKFMALFFNQEEKAEEIFSAVEKRYEALCGKVIAISYSPSVLMGYEMNGKWNMPGGKSYAAALVRDAGGLYLWADDDTTGRIPLSFEAVLEKGAQASFWINQSLSWESIEDMNNTDPRYQAIKAYELNQIYNNNARLSPQGGNEYNESGIVNPDRILADLISIFHPGILEDHEVYYYRHLDTGAK